jgi:O-Antigen ligase
LSTAPVRKRDIGSTQSIIQPTTKGGTKRRNTGSARDKFRLSGSTIVIVGFVFSQFVDITVGNIGGIVISVQKIEAAFFLLIGFLLLSPIRARIEWLFVATSFFTAFALALLLEARVTEVASAGFTLLLSIISAIVLANAISVRTDRLRVFAQAWIWASLITSLLAIGQALGKIPTLVTPGDLTGALVRGSGLKADPNFSAMLLVLGLVFSRFYLSRVQRRYVWLLLLMGLLATSSRMGIIVGAGVVVWSAGLPYNPLGRQPHATRGLRTWLRVRRLLLLLAAGLVAFSFAPSKVQTYVQIRGADLTAAYDGIVYGTVARTSNGSSQTSGSERAQLDRLTLDIFQQHWVTGIGAGQVPLSVEERIGFAKAGHDTYLETAAVGGIFGITALIVYLVALRRLVKRSANDWVDSIDLNCTMLIFVSMAAMAIVLTLDYNSIFWLPLALVAGIARKPYYQDTGDRWDPREDFENSHA